LLTLSLWLIACIHFRLYRLPEKRGVWNVQVAALENAVALTTVTAVVTFFSRGLGELISRVFIPVLLLEAFVLFSVSRYVSAALVPLISRLWNQPPGVALVGDRETARRLLESMKENQAVSVKGLILPASDVDQPTDEGFRVLGYTSQLAELINSEGLNWIVLLNTALPAPELEFCSLVCRRMDVSMSYSLDFAQDPFQAALNSRHGLPLVDLVPAGFTRRQEILKRYFDILVSAMAIILFSPILIAISLLVKATSKGPVFHKSLRIGKGGRVFTFLKIRSMFVGVDRAGLAEGKDANGHLFKIKNDPRVTPVGRFLRRYSLDELPQLINILRGDMSFVGPRPLPACDLGPDGMSASYAAWSEGRAKVQPGLTGLWQISGRSDLSFEDMVRLDLSYIQNWSLVLDLRILLYTPGEVLRGAGAY
jgi:exopolysaccharide biosynthesis polyprenyl glycosylphosphotransferase